MTANFQNVEQHLVLEIRLTFQDQQLVAHHQQDTIQDLFLNNQRNRGKLLGPVVIIHLVDLI